MAELFVFCTKSVKLVVVFCSCIFFFAYFDDVSFTRTYRSRERFLLYVSVCAPKTAISLRFIEAYIGYTLEICMKKDGLINYAQIGIHLFVSERRAISWNVYLQSPPLWGLA